MTTVDWGPLPALMAHLGDPITRTWAARLPRPGGLWSVAAEGRITALWPQAYPPRAPDPPTTPSLAGRLQILSASLAGAEHRAARGERLVIDSHRWLGRRNLVRLAPWFVPFWMDTPTPLVRVSPRGVAWATLACHLDRRGSRRVPMVGYRRPTDGDSEMVCVGDAVALHLAIEDVVAGIARRFAGLARPPHVARRPGGLRTAVFLGAVPWLATSQSGDHISWWRALQLLIAQSPLTQLIYPEFAPPEPGRRPEQFQPVFRALPESDASPTEQSAASATRLCHTPGPVAARDSCWLEVWHSLVARSLLAGLWSPPPAFEREQDARHRAAMNKNSGFLAAAATAATALLRGERAQMRMRLPLLASACGADAGFHVRWVDMAVRSVAQECEPEISSAWRGEPRDYGREARDFYFLGRSSLCFRRFQTMLLGKEAIAAITGDVIEAQHATDNAPASPFWTVDRVSALVSSLRVPDLDDTSLAKASGLPLPAADRLLTAFRSRRLTLPVPERVGHTPERIWRAWTNELLDHLTNV